MTLMNSSKDFVGTEIKYGRQEIEETGNMTRCILVSTCLVYRLMDFNFVIASPSTKYEPVHEISSNMVCATSKASYQPAHTRSLIRAFASRLSIL